MHFCPGFAKLQLEAPLKAKHKFLPSGVRAIVPGGGAVGVFLPFPFGCELPAANGGPAGCGGCTDEAEKADEAWVIGTGS
eukprot:71678-Amphidinium_carterae.1